MPSEFSHQRTAVIVHSSETFVFGGRGLHEFDGTPISFIKISLFGAKRPFEQGWFHTIEAPVSKSFRSRFFFVRKPRNPAKTRDVTPVFSATYVHAAAVGLSLPPTHALEMAVAGNGSCV